MSQVDEWDRLYRGNGRAWRGSCRLPDPLGGRGRALDAGCGCGKSASTLIDLGYDVTGVDFSPEAVGACRERFGDRGDFVVADLTGLPFPDGSFDYAVAVHSLGHLEDREFPEAVQELLRVLRPGGYLFVRDFAPGDMRESSREGSGIVYRHRLPEGIVPLLAGCEVLSSGVLEERTRFGGVRRRTEVLARRLRRKHR